MMTLSPFHSKAFLFLIVSLSGVFLCCPRWDQSLCGSARWAWALPWHWEELHWHRRNSAVQWVHIPAESLHCSRLRRLPQSESVTSAHYWDAWMTTRWCTLYGQRFALWTRHTSPNCRWSLNAVALQEIITGSKRLHVPAWRCSGFSQSQAIV